MNSSGKFLISDEITGSFISSGLLIRIKFPFSSLGKVSLTSTFNLSVSGTIKAYYNAYSGAAVTTATTSTTYDSTAAYAGGTGTNFAVADMTKNTNTGVIRVIGTYRTVFPALSWSSSGGQSSIVFALDAPSVAPTSATMTNILAPIKFKTIICVIFSIKYF